MKTKKVISLLQLLIVSGVLASCGKNDVLNGYRPAGLRGVFELKDDFKSSSSNVYIGENGQVIKINDPEDPTVNQLQELVMSQKIASIYYSDSKYSPFNETLQLSVSGLPKKAVIGNVTWASSNTSVATVNQNGLVTAVKEGTSIIKATSETGKVAECKVVVNNDNILSVKNVCDNILAAQKAESFEPVTRVALKEDYLEFSTRDGEVVSSTNLKLNFVAAKDEPYFRYFADYEEVLTSSGSVVPSSAYYTFTTNEDYYSYIYCNSDGKANFMALDQLYLVDEGKSPLQGLYEMLDSFFKSGSSIMTDNMDDVLSTKELTSGYVGAKYKGTFGESSGQVAFNTYKEQPGYLDYDSSQSIGIPYGTPLRIIDDNRYLFEDNLLIYESIIEKFIYELDGQDRTVELNINKYYQTRNVVLDYPNSKDYTQVDSIFDL